MPNDVTHSSIYADDDQSAKRSYGMAPFVLEKVVGSRAALGILGVAVLLMTLLLGSSAAAEEGGGSAEDHDEVTKEVLAFAESYLETLESGDPEKVRELFVADGRFAWHTDGKKRYSTPGEVVEGLEELAASGMKLTTEFFNSEAIPLTPSLATFRTSFRTEGTVAGRPTFEYAGVVTMILERSPSGSWRVLSGHTSTPGGPP